MKLSWEVDGADIVAEKLEEGLEDGMERAVDQILEHLERNAKDRIAVRPAIFTGEVYEGFDDQTTSAKSSSGIKSRFINYSKHAGALEHGVHPSKYADGAPPVTALMPWVIAKMSDWQVDVDGGGGSSVQTPTAGDDDSPSDDPEDINSDYEADWTRFHKNGYSEEQLWVGQDVTIYVDAANSYRPATVTSVDLRGTVEVEADMGYSYTYNYYDGTTIDGSGIVVGEDWESLSESEQRGISKEMLLSEIDVSNDFGQSWESDIEDVLTTWGENLKDPMESKRLAMGLSSIKKDDTMPKKGKYSGSSVGGSITYNTNLGDKGTIFHEITHAWLYFKNYHYVTGARHTDPQKGETWDSVKHFKSGPMPWNYNSVNKADWDTSSGDHLPHPTTYMVYDDEDRENVGVYDDVNAPGFDQWEEHVRKSTIYELQDADLDTHGDLDPGDYDDFYTERMVLEPGGKASEGDALRFSVDNSDEYPDVGVVYHNARIESPVYETDDGGYEIEVSVEGNKDILAVTSNGEFAEDNVGFEGYLAGSSSKLDKELDESDIPEDPGFHAGSDEVDERFKEALNRKEWQEMIAVEVGNIGDKEHFLLRDDAYSSANGHEIAAHLFPIILADKSMTSGEIQKLEDLLDHSPELLYMVSQKIEFSPKMVDALERKSGLSFDDLMYDIWRNEIK